MSYRVEKTQNGQDLVISGWENGVATSPHDGIANMQNVNISTEPGEVMCSYNRTQQAQTIQGTGTLTVVDTSTVSITGVTLLPGSWIHIVSNSGTGLSGDYYYMGNGKLSTAFSRSVSSAVNPTALTTIFLTSGTTWSVPADWNSASNTVETLGAGGGSGAGGAGKGSGGGGGAYSKKSNITLTPSGSAAYVVGAKGNGGGGGGAGTSGGDTYFNGASLAASSVGSKGGGGGAGNSGAAGTGGASASGIGDTKYSGGDGAAGATNGGGGGGAAGLNGVGGNASSSTGGTGDNGSGGTGGSGTNPDPGGNGTEWDSTHGSGGGGGGAPGAGNNQGGNGGLYGAAGGGGAPFASGADGTQGLIVIKYSALGTTATFSVYTMGKPVQSATEPYTDDSGVSQYRYYILDDTGYTWMHDTATPASLPNPAWARIDATYTIGTRIASGLAILNGWLAYTLDQNIYWRSTVLLGSSAVASSTLQLSTNYFHAALVGHQGKLYHTDGNFLSSIFPNSSLLSGTANIQSYCKYTASTTTGTVATLIGGAYPASSVRIPAVFFTDGTKPNALTVGTIYYIKWLFPTVAPFNTFEVYAAASGGAALDIQTGSVGNQYFNTFYPTSAGGLTTITFSAQRLNLPFFETSQSLAEIGNTVLVGCKLNTIYKWNQVSATPQDFIVIPENNAVKMITVNNMAYVFAGQKGNIYITSGSSVDPAISVPDYCAGIAGTPASYIEPYFTWGDAMYMRGRIWFSILDQTSAKTGNCGGIWSFTPSTQTPSIRQENQSSYGTLNGVATVLLPSQVQTVIGPQYWSGWYSSISTPTYGIDFSDTIPTTPAVIETDLIPTGTLLSKRTFEQIEYKLAAPLAAGETVGISYRQNATDSYVPVGTAKTESTTGLSGYFPATFQLGQWLQLKITLTPLASASSSFCRLSEIRVR